MTSFIFYLKIQNVDVEANRAISEQLMNYFSPPRYLAVATNE